MIELLLRVEGRAGLLYAHDVLGNTVSANDAVAGVRYKCPKCGCPMHVLTSKLGNRVFARNSGAEHTNVKCKLYEERMTKHTFDTLEPEVFIQSLCMVSQRDGDRGPAGTRAGSDRGTSNDDFRTLPFGSLKQIADEIDFLDGGLTQGNHKVSDFVLTFKSAKQVIQGDRFNLGARIVFCRFAFCDDRNQAILFNLFGKGNEIFIRFRLVFPRCEEYRAYRKKFVEYAETEDGRTLLTKKHEVQDLLIACDTWVFLDQPVYQIPCHTKAYVNCYGMYQAVFTNPKQIYLLPVKN